jgi:predicted transcriptional regulator
MSAKRLNIGIRSAADSRRELRETFARIGKGDRSAREPALYFENIDMLRRVLTEKRFELLSAIVRDRPASVHRLAQLLGRDYKNVSDDVALFGRLGLITLKTVAGKGKALAPTVPYDEIRVTIDLRHFGEVRAA